MTERIIAKHESEVPSIKRIGIIGGLGQWATLDIVNKILQASAVRVPQYGNRGYPPMDIRMLNRAPMLLNKDGSYPDILEPSPELLNAARFVGADADFLIVTANTAHLFKEAIEKAAGKPLLSIVDETMKQVKQKKYKRVGVLAIGVTLERGLFQNPLEKIGVESVLLPKDLGQRLDDEGIYPLQEGAKPDEVSGSAYDAVDYLRKQKVNGIILGCTEIPILLGQRSDENDIINPSQLLAERAVKKALGID